MIWIWALAAVLVLLAGLRYLLRLRAARGTDGAPAVDDDALREILRTGRLSTPDDEPLDMEEAGEAEEEFWSEEWDEPEEYRP